MVLSHEPLFLRLLWDSTEKSNLKSLQFYRIGDYTVIGPWDIEHATQGNYFENISCLKKYVEPGEGNPRDVARNIRVVLEDHLRFGFPFAFSDNEWLGDMIDKVKNSSEDDNLYLCKDILPELEDLNDYSKRYHHGTNPNAGNEPVDEGELLSFVKRTIKIVRAC